MSRDLWLEGWRAGLAQAKAWLLEQSEQQRYAARASSDRDEIEDGLAEAALIADLAEHMDRLVQAPPLVRSPY